MAETITMPKLGFDMQEGTLVRWLRTEGEGVEKGDVLAEIETDKATVEVEASAGGVVRKLLVDPGAVVPIGEAIAIVGSPDEKIEIPPKSAAGAETVPETASLPAAVPSTSRTGTEVPEPEAFTQEAGQRKASPIARRLAREANLDLAEVEGTGPAGRIVRKDIEAALMKAGATAGPAGGSYVAPAGQLASREDEMLPISRLRQAIARRMTESKRSVPHFYVTHEYQMDRLLDLREQANSVLPAEEKISVNDFVIKAVALCLREFRNLNSAYHGDQVLRHGAINIGAAVAVEGGLMTVVCKDADQKPVRQISAELKAMAARARSGKVHPADIEGSTFTVSNLGMYEVESFGAIINPPEAGILAVGSARQVPVVEQGEIRAGWRMKATIAVDHRVSDGSEAAQFMQALAQYIEAPLSMFL
jgi:pyruvate dehydrogenase E2 component (dihydrolipoamide acetyltransferase)